jgi:cell division septation protein DedD
VSTVTRAALALAAALAACAPGTRRPPFTPLPESRSGALEVTIPDATRRLAEALRAAGMPVTRVELRDGYVETAWFDTATAQPTSRRPLGAGIVRVRGWVDPSEYGYSQMTVEAVYRPAADPSLAPRELERAVPYDHPTRGKLRDVLASMGARAIGREPDAPPPVVATTTAGTDTADRNAGAATKGGKRRAPGDEPLGPVDPGKRRGAAPGDTTARVTPLRDSTPPRPAARDTTPAAIAAPAPATPRPAPAQPVSPQPATPRPATPRPTPPAAPARSGFTVQVAAAPTRPEAESIANRLRALGEAPQIVAEGGLFKVRTAGYPTRTAASARLARIRSAFADAFVVPPR